MDACTRRRPLGRLIGLAAALGLVAATTGCGEESDPPEDKPAPAFPEDSGQSRMDSADVDYPVGPFGYTLGSIVPNYGFYGWVRPIDDMDQGYASYIELAEFYNPTGDGVYPEGSAFPVGSPKPKALLVDVSAVWCVYCRQEARDVLPERRAMYFDQGGEFLVNLAENGDGTAPATFQDLLNWGNQYDVDYPLVLDPDYRFMMHGAGGGWPSNMIIDTRTMQVVHAIAGGPQEPDSSDCNLYPNDPVCRFWPVYEEVLAGTYTLD